jgi:hypothetical protein
MFYTQVGSQSLNWHYDFQHNNIQQNYIQHNSIQHNDTQHGLIWDTQQKPHSA